MSGKMPLRITLSMLLAFGQSPAFAQDASAILESASKAMGAASLKSLRYAGEGIGYTYGQAFKPGMAWPKINVHSQVRTVNYETGSMRDEIVLSRAEPQGGGGYPLAGQQRNDQYVSGSFAWNQLGPAPLPGPRFVVDRVHQLWVTPHGAIKAAIRNGASRSGGAGTTPAVAFTEPGRFSATVFVDRDNLVERVESRVPDPVLGEVEVVTIYSGYRDFAGVKFPTRIRQSAGGHPVLDLEVKQVEPNAAAEIAVPDLVRAFSERVTADKIAEGVWFLGGGSHNSVAIEMKDHVVLVEAPLNEGRTVPVIEQVKKVAPGKPIRYVVNSHSHFDHSGGVRAAVAEGATVVTQADNRAYFERAFATHSKIAPDRLAQSGRTASFSTVGDKLVLEDGERSVEIHRILGSVHNDTFLMVYLPREKLLVQADAYTPGLPNTPPPDKPNANNVNLVENIERLKLSVDRILPLHGRVVPVAELYTAIGRRN